MRLYKDKPNYVRLDDDVSFQILRTNPKLTTNTKLMYDGENLYMDSYPVNSILSTMKYKHHRVWKSGLFNRDIRNFLLGTDKSAYEVGQKANNITILNNFDNQFENTYWCGVESIDSDIYPQEMGCIAPLYLRKKRPNYFVIFKIDTPANTNSAISDLKFEFTEDFRNRSKILKTFDLREGTPIGNYIKRYVEQSEFKYDQSIYVNFSAHKIYYYGIDKSLGVLTQKVENFEDDLLNNDNPVLKDDNWITSGFERNNLIFPYIINLEFLFDDKDIGEYKFARYYGMYCNDIDLCDMGCGSCSYDENYNNSVFITKWGDNVDIDIYDENNFYYIKDKNRNLYSISGSYTPGLYKIPGKVTDENFKGFEVSTVSTYGERIPGVGKAIMILEIMTKLDKNDTVTVYDELSHETAGTFIATMQYPKGEAYNNRFSCKGTIADTAYALAQCIKNCKTDNFNWVTAFSMGNKVIIQALYPGANMNGLFNFSGSTMQVYPPKIKKLMNSFVGGTDKNNCMFKVYTDDADVFVDNSDIGRNEPRYLKCGIGRENAKILGVIPYINEENKIDDTYSVIITDEMGPYVNVTNTDQIEILDKFYPKIGVLSFFPVKDFDFDTIKSAYGDYTMLEDEMASKQNAGEIKDLLTILFGDEFTMLDEMRLKDAIPYKRFYSEGKDVNTEYDYYCENILPELSTESKTAPYITKWCYMDDAKDSCENPYRLNVSKIFETSNFSANTFVEKADITEFTHSMPYYLVRTDGKEHINEYQYIPYSNEYWTNNYESLLEYFSNTTPDGEDPFEAMFGDISRTADFTNRRFNKKYSRFLLGNNVVKSSTLFRGVKFEVTELENGKEIKTGKYNDYRFSFIYIPVANMENNDYKVYFIKNDTYKFIVGFVFFDLMLNKLDDKTLKNKGIALFNKSYVYTHAMGIVDSYRK